MLCKSAESQKNAIFARGGLSIFLIFLWSATDDCSIWNDSIVCIHRWQTERVKLERERCAACVDPAIGTAGRARRTPMCVRSKERTEGEREE